MNIKRIHSFFLAGLLGMASGTPMSAYADDTEIFTGGAGGTGVRPNVLFILDTSGSMSSTDGTDPPVDRLDRMKEALNILLDNVDNVNIGLMRFTDPGGPILFPVAGVDEDANAIDAAGQTDVSVRVSNGADDAEELITLGAGSPAPPGILGTVLLDGLYLELGETPAFGTELSTVLQIDSGDEDAEQSTQFYNNNSTILEMVDNGGAGLRSTGYRFDDFPADTDGATVALAQLGLTPRSSRSGALNVRIFGRLDDEMPVFPGSGGNQRGACPAALASQDMYCRLGLTTTAAYNGGLNTTNLESYQVGATPGGLITDAIVDWNNVPDTITDDQIFSPDVGPILEEIFALPGWQTSGRDSVGLFYTGTTSSWRDIRSHDDSNTRAAVLTLDYMPAGAPFGRQLVALRFRDVKIPQGAKIENANVELYSAGQSSEAVDIVIAAEKVINAPVFQAGGGLPVADRLSGRLSGNGTAARVTWNITEAWNHEEAIQTPDIAAVVQEVTDQSNWCGGNDLVVFLDYDVGSLGSRRVHAYDADPSLAATLRLDYDVSAVPAGKGCTTETVIRQVSGDLDDAEQNASTGAVSLTSSSIQMMQTATRTQVNGFIFRGVPIYNNATVRSAEIQFTAEDDGVAANAASVTVTGQLDKTIATFQSSSFNIINRINAVGNPTIATETFGIPPAAVNSNDRFSTADLSSIVGEVVAQGSWEYGDDMAFIFQGTGRVDVESHDADPSKAAILRVLMEYNVGDVETVGGAAVVPVRTRLKEIVADLTHEGYTPIVDTLLEAHDYFTGGAVRYGASRGTGSASLRQNTRISHPGSYDGGTVNYPAGCTDSNLSSAACAGQTITGNPTYISPIEEDCQANYLVLLTDGFANHNHSAGLIPSVIPGGAACQTSYDNGDAVSSGELCGVDLVRYMNKSPDPLTPGEFVPTDLNPDVDGDNNLTTYTIGFNFSTEFLRDMAKAGGGEFKTAETSAQLAQVFEEIIADVLANATSFAAPSLSINAFNRLEDRNEVYFSLFEPAASARWDGNIKRYALCDSLDSDCVKLNGFEVGDILDKLGNEAVDSDGRILSSAISFWTGTADGPDVRKGGAGQHIPRHDDGVRRVFTFLGNNLTLSGNDTFDPAAELDELVDLDEDGIIDSMSGGTSDEQKARTEDLLLLPAPVPPPATPPTPADIAARNAQIKGQVDWIRGKDVDGEFAEPPIPSASENRYPFGDALHGNPLAITFGGTAAEPVVKLVVGTNDGGIRMINSFNGIEEWIFFPADMLGIQSDLRANPATGKVYGMDGTPSLWIRDDPGINGDDAGIINPDKDDFVRVFLGQRRGGSRYYGLELVPPSGAVTSQSATTEVTPKLLWTITGGTPEFARLGQSWSRPFLAEMLVGTDTVGNAVRKRVIIFAGGYEEDQDGGFQISNSTGNAVYVVDAKTGDRLYVISGPGSLAEHGLAVGDPGITEVTDMVYPIPSDVAAFDSDGDQAIDRLYVGDAGGQVFRVDFAPDRSANIEGITATVGKLAELSTDASASDQRKIFYPPTVVQVRGVGAELTGEYDLVGVATGNRANPLNITVRDRFYAVRDYYLSAMNPEDLDDDGLSDDYQDPSSGDNPVLGALVGELDPQGDPTGVGARDGDLLDITDIANPTAGAVGLAGGATATEIATFKAFNAAKGYYIKLQAEGVDAGEKALAGPTTLAGKLFFTTYLPEGEVPSTTCALPVGSGLLYAINVISGAAIENFYSDPKDPLTPKDRILTLGSGIPSSPVGVFLPEKVMLLIGIGGGAKSIDPKIGKPQERTYWFEAPAS